MAEYLISGDTLTGIAEAIRGKTGGTDPIEVSDMAAQIESITGGGSSDIALLEKQDVTGFAYDSEFGAFAKHYNPAVFTLEAGKEYRVQWDGEERACTAYTVTTLGYPIICIGNGAQIGGESAGENFLIAYTPAANHLTLFAIDTNSSHNVGVYEVAKATSDDVRYVTFMSYDGTVKYGVKPVAVGDDCADPIARGLFETPTRESDVQYNYSFNGWATTVNGGANANALKAVEEDRTVYANFISTLRYYTITYLDTDGSVLKTESLAYGSTPSYRPTNSEYDFAGWEPAAASVTCDASYTVVWKVKATFETATWEEIAAICASGNHTEFFAVGDSKPVTLTYDNGTSETINFTIVDMDVDPISPTEKAPLTIMAENIVSISPTKLASAYNKHQNFFYDNDVAKTFLGRVFSALPEDLQLVIKPYMYLNLMGVRTTNIFTPHSVNLGIAHNAWGGPDTPVYNAKYKHFANGSSIKRTKKTDSTMDNYWTSARVRSISGGNYTSYYYLAIDGVERVSSAQSADSASHGIVPCFCI